MSYSAEISRRSPTAFVLLIDQSGSMAESFGLDSTKSKAAFVADVVNKWIDNLVLRCARGMEIRDYFEVAVLGYAGGVRSALPSVGDGIRPISELAESPLRIEDRKRMTDDGTGGVIEAAVKFRVWVDAQAGADTPMCAALAKARVMLATWIEEHPDAYPPTVLNITDGGATDGDPRDAAESLRQLATSDGEILLLNCHISGFGGSPTLYPSSVGDLPDDLAQTLFDMSSQLPERVLDGVRGAGYPVGEDARGFAYQADAAALIKFIEIGTRASEIVVRE